MIQSLEGMDLADRLHEMSGRIKQRIDNVKTEEATKTALVMPFINHVLGYNVFDPAEFVPEFITDVGTKKGEKVDYAIFRDGDPIMLFECKHYGVDLGKEPASQLYRYFGVSKSRFGVLTDGVIYRFYSDIDEQNKMDARPFLEINMLDVEAIDVDELKRFTKTSFDVEQILSTAKDLKYTREILRLLTTEWTDPSEALVRHFAAQIYEGVKTKAVIEQFTRAHKEGPAPVRGKTHQRPVEVGAGEHRPRRTRNRGNRGNRRRAGGDERRNGDRDDRGRVAGLLRRHSDLEPRGRPQADQYPGRKEPVRDPARQHEPTAHLSAVLQQGTEEDRPVERAEGRRARRHRVDQRHLRACGPDQGDGPPVRGPTERDTHRIVNPSRQIPAAKQAE